MLQGAAETEGQMKRKKVVAQEPLMEMMEDQAGQKATLQ